LEMLIAKLTDQILVWIFLFTIRLESKIIFSFKLIVLS
jgi:hypothetical protein